MDEQVVNHQEAFELAGSTHHKSNLARCYLGLRKMVESLAGITFNGQANPRILLMEQDAKIKKLEKERVVAAALQFKTVGPHGNPITFVVMVERPGRHHHCGHAVVGAFRQRSLGAEQGFLTSEGRFVDRKEAAILARAAGQPIIRESAYPDHAFSEDFW